MGGPYPFKAASFASLDLHVEVANDVSSSAKGIYNQQELQQLTAAIAGQLKMFFFSPPIVSINF